MIELRLLWGATNERAREGATLAPDPAGHSLAVAATDRLLSPLLFSNTYHKNPRRRAAGHTLAYRSTDATLMSSPGEIERRRRDGMHAPRTNVFFQAVC